MAWQVLCRYLPPVWPPVSTEFADPLEWILKNNYNLKWVLHYLDDYFLAGPPSSTSCKKHLCCFLQVCRKLGFPVATEKVEGPATILTFLGLELDSVKQQISLPADKLHQILQELQLWLRHRKKVTKRELLSLIGKLVFAARAVPAGRLFLRRLISLSTKAKSLHHHIREAHADIMWWHSTWNGTAPLLEVDVTDAHDW